MWRLRTCLLPTASLLRARNDDALEAAIYFGISCDRQVEECNPDGCNRRGTMSEGRTNASLKGTCVRLLVAALGNPGLEVRNVREVGKSRVVRIYGKDYQEAMRRSQLG